MPKREVCKLKQWMLRGRSRLPIGPNSMLGDSKSTMISEPYITTMNSMSDVLCWLDVQAVPR